MCYDEVEWCAQINPTFLGSQLGGPVMEKYLSRGALHCLWQHGLVASLDSILYPHLLLTSCIIPAFDCCSTWRGTEGGLHPRPKSELFHGNFQVKSPQGWNSAWMVIFVALDSWRTQSWWLGPGELDICNQPCGKPRVGVGLREIL